MATEADRLIAVLEARIDKFEKGMAKAQATANKNLAAIEARGKKMSATLETSMGAAFRSNVFTPMVAGASAAVLSVLSVQAAITKTREALDRFGDIADKSATAGVDPEFFQGLAYQASLAGVQMNDLAGALATFSKNSALAVAGKGKMVAALGALDSALLESIRNADTQEERIRLVVEGLDKTADASKRAAIASAAFGDAGAKLAVALAGGNTKLNEMQTRARDLGITIDGSLIARADELGDQLDTATQIMNTQFSAALVSLSPILIKAAELAADVAKAIGMIVDSMQSLENMTSRGLEDELRAAGIKRLEIEQQILEKRQEQRELSDVAVSNGFGDRINGEIAALEQQNAALTENEKKVLDIINARKAAQEALTKPGAGKGDDGTTLPPLPTPGSSTTRGEGASDVERQQKAVTDLIEKLKFEQDQIGKTDLEIAKMNALREAGATATDTQKAEIEAIVEATYREQQALKALEEAQNLARDAANGFLTDLRAGLEDGRLTWEDFGNAALGVLDKIINKLQGDFVDALLGTGTQGGFLSTLFGGLLGGGTAGAGGVPAYASGTGYAPGGIVSVGERGPELVRLPQGSQVIPNGRISSVMAGGGGGPVDVHVSVGVAVDDSGGLRAYVKEQSVQSAVSVTRAGLEAFSREALPKRVNEIARKPRKIG